jgi:manganese/zinc/iron transport system permease protein
MEAIYIIATGAVIAASCGLLGSFLVLRKMAMMGDAISHAVLPGIVIAFLISGSRDNIPMLVGAASVGVLTTVLIGLLYRKAKLNEDASIGVTFTFLFAVGVILVSYFADQVDLDQDCVLYGEIAYVPLDLIKIGDRFLGPRALWIASGLLIVILLFLWKGYKGLYITTFNPDYAGSLGISTVFWHYALMSLVSLTTVISFESVGAILVVALLVVPPATAYLFTHKLKSMLWLTVLFGVISAAGGYYIALWFDGSVSGGMTIISGLLFTIAFLRSLIKPKPAPTAK